MKRKPFIAGKSEESKTSKYMEDFDPSTGGVIARVPCFTKDEVEAAVAAAKAVYPKWRDTPAHKRAQLLYDFRNLINDNIEELMMLFSSHSSCHRYPSCRICRLPRDAGSAISNRLGVT